MFSLSTGWWGSHFDLAKGMPLAEKEARPGDMVATVVQAGGPSRGAKLCMPGQRGPVFTLSFSFWYYNDKLLLVTAARLVGLWGFKKCAYFYNWGSAWQRGFQNYAF